MTVVDRGYLVCAHAAIIVVNTFQESIKYIGQLPSRSRYLVVKPEELNGKTLNLLYQIM